MHDPHVLGPGVARFESPAPDFWFLQHESRSGEAPSIAFARGAAVGALAVCACAAAIHAKRMRVAHYRAVLLTLDAEDEDATAVLDAARTVVDSVASHLWCYTIPLTRAWVRLARTAT